MANESKRDRLNFLLGVRRHTELADNLFTDRYAKVTTNNGREINSATSNSTGYGIWRLTRPDIEYIVQYQKLYSSDPDLSTTPDYITTIPDYQNNDGVTSDFFHNVKTICQDYRFNELPDIAYNQTAAVDQILELLNDHHCLSLIALCTLLKISGSYPVSSDFEEQRKLIIHLTDQIVIDFDVALEIEQKANEEICAWADIDFEFVLDSSG